MKPTIIKRLAALFLIVALTVPILGCFTTQNSSNVTSLAKIEVKNYKGKKLSSLTDFVENSIKGPQFIEQATYRLKIDGLVDKPQNYSYGDVVDKHKKYSKVVTLNCVEGWSVTILWEGVLVRDLLNEAGVKNDAQVVILYAHDGYSTSFQVSYFKDHDILMAYKMNGVTVPPERGFPFVLVAEDKWGYKWIKWIDHIELSDNLNYQGYWESRGYSNTGNLKEPYFK
jgi:DMSO/TMAO reductase YedYZ molybdopterin-dependent catalytic subunit